MMWMFLVACRGYELVAAETTIQIASTRRDGHAEDVLDFELPCIDQTVAHTVRMDWVVDRGAAVPYDDVP